MTECPCNLTFSCLLFEPEGEVKTLNKDLLVQPPLIIVRMTERTEASVALERLAWTLNFHEGETVSVNKIAEKTNLSWATANKYIQVLERLSRIAPELSRDDSGVLVKSVGDNLASIHNRTEIQLIVYLIIHAENKGGSIEPILIEEHTDVLARYDTTIERLLEIGWIEVNNEENSIRLTPAGAAQAGQARSKLRNTDVKTTSFDGIVKKKNVIRLGDIDIPPRWASGDFASESTSQGTGAQTSSGYNPGEYQSKSARAGGIST